MRYFIILAILFFVTSHADAQRIRRLLLFSNDSTNVMLKTQRQWLESDKKGVEDRDIWIAVFHDPKTFRRMYEHYDVGRAEFFFILTDKDGTEKIRSEELVTLKELFDVIDGKVVQMEK
ncbi:MAG: DUF4174 domain-containing protein [Bacteroidota bacterium]